MTEIWLNDAVLAQFEMMVAEPGPFLGPEVIAEHVTVEDDPAVFGRFDALDKIDGDLWVISGLLAATDYGPVVRRLAVAPFPPNSEREVSIKTLRLLRIAALRDRAFVRLRFQTATVTGERPTVEQRAQVETVADERPRRRGRPPLPDEHYRGVALEYLRLVKERGGQSRGLNAALADIESKRRGREIPEETIRGWISGARKRGYLSQTRPGRSGASPGPLLNQHDEEGGTT